MEWFLNLFLRILRGLLKLTMLALAGALVFALLSFALVWLVFVVLWSLLTGRKPAIFTTVSRFRQTSDNLRKGIWPGFNNRQATNTDDIVDVQAHDVRLPLEHLPPAPMKD